MNSKNTSLNKSTEGVNFLGSVLQRKMLMLT